MYTNSLRKFRVFLALVLFSAILINASHLKALAASTLSVSQTVDNNKVTFKVSDSVNITDAVSILVMPKGNNSAIYMDQATLINGEYIFETLLPKGEYTGFVSSSSSNKVAIQDIVILSDEKIVGFRPLKPINVGKGENIVLPSIVIAIFGDGTNREVGVQWTEVPSTDIPGQYTVIGIVNGSTETVKLVLNIGDISDSSITPASAVFDKYTQSTNYRDVAVTVTFNGNTLNAIKNGSSTLVEGTDYRVTGNLYTIKRSYLAGFSTGNTVSLTFDFSAGADSSIAITIRDTTPSGTGGTTAPATTNITVNGLKTSTAVVLDAATSTAKAEVSTATISTALANATADSKGVKTVEILIPKVEGAKSYEPVLPASILTQAAKTQVIEVNTPIGTIELPGNMVKASQAAGATTIAVSMGAVEKSTITDAKLKEAIGDRPVVELNLKVDGNVVSWENKEAPVKVSIPYTPKAEELKNNEHVVIWYIDGTGNAVKVPNAKYDAAAGLVTFKTTHFSKYAVSYAFKTFADTGTYPWAQKQIEVLASKGIINGTSDTTFSPGDNITRADFLVLLVGTLGLTADISDNFLDVNKGDYYYDALGAAKKLGISTGVGGNTFNPKEQISRQDMMVLCARALKASEVIKAQGSAADIQKFSDKTDVASYAVESIASMVKEGIVTGNGDILNPQGNATRAETAVIMYRIFNKLLSN